MSRVTIITTVLLAVVLGFAAGWWLFGLMYEVPVSPVTHESASSSVLPRITSGFCCVTAGQGCIETETAAACFSQRGKGFNTQQATCDHFCIAIGSLGR